MSFTLRCASFVCTAVGLAALIGCGGGGSSHDGGSLDGRAPFDGGGDAAIADAGSDAGTTQDVCDELGLPHTPMQASTGSGFEDVAGDFTVHTLDGGSFTLSDEWTGCESYVFINYTPNTYGQNLWATLPDPLLERTARNVHYFFASYDTLPAVAQERVRSVQAKVEDAFNYLHFDDAQRAFWRAHIHYVTDPLPTVEGSVGDLVRGTPYDMPSFAITREQRFDPVGSLDQVTSAGFGPRFAMAAFASQYYDYLADLDARIDAETDATVVPLLDETVTDRVFQRTVTLPDATTMATFDTLEVDVSVICRADPSNCSQWDRIAHVDVCTDSTCTEHHELARWITPYSRPGRRRWLIDASPLLGLLSAGGPTTFYIEMGPDWETHTERDAHIALRLRHTGAAQRAVGADLAFTGGTFDSTYNAMHPPFHFTPPADATKVALVTLLTGHGQTAGNNCAEWCNHVHTFTVNRTATHRIDFPGQAGVDFGCATRASEGVVPNQWGNWAPGRAAWCPGLAVAPKVIDITSEVTLGADNELDYQGSFNGGDPAGGTIDLSAYVVYYR